MSVETSMFIALFALLFSSTAFAGDAVVKTYPAKNVKLLKLSASSGSISVVTQESLKEIKVEVENDEYLEMLREREEERRQRELERRERELERRERERARRERRESDRSRDSGEDSNEEDEEWDEFFGRSDENDADRAVRSELSGGQLALKVRNGDMKVYAPKGIDVSVKSQSGELELSGDFGNVDIRGWSGSIRMKGTAAGLDAKTLSGDVDVDVRAPVQQVESISGDVKVAGKSTDLTVAATSGDILVRYMPERLNAKTVSGEIKIKGELAKSSVHEFEAVSGDVYVWITNGTGFNVSATSFDSDLWINDQRFEGKVKKTVGDGSATLRIATMNGEVRIKQEK